MANLAPTTLQTSNCFRTTRSQGTRFLWKTKTMAASCCLLLFFYALWYKSICRGTGCYESIVSMFHPSPNFVSVMSL
ncbi:hypothetical protein BDN67DRAFT_976119, partial [Paxillus ammoniavirescens]